MSVRIENLQRSRYYADTIPTDNLTAMEVLIATLMYCRVSTADQNVGIQLDDAIKAGYRIDEVVADDGVSGVSTKLSERPQGKRLFDMLRGGDTLVVRWVDRLGRNYDDVTTTIRTFMQKGVVIRTIINNMTFDGSTKDPVQMAVRDALIGFMAATAEAQAEAIKHAQKAGIAKAKQNGTKYRGRKPSYDRATFDVVRSMINAGSGVSAIANETGLSRQAIMRIRNEPAKVEESLEKWETCYSS